MCQAALGLVRLVGVRRAGCKHGAERERARRMLSLSLFFFLRPLPFQGVPPALRPWVWASASSAAAAARSHGPDYYQAIVACGEAECATAARQIDLVRR